MILFFDIILFIKFYFNIFILIFLFIIHNTHKLKYIVNKLKNINNSISIDLNIGMLYLFDNILYLENINNLINLKELNIDITDTHVFNINSILSLN